MMATATKSKGTKAAANKAAASGKVETVSKPKAAPTINLDSMDESALLEALSKKREGKKAAIIAAIDSIQALIDESTADLRAQIEAKRSELRALGGHVRSGNGSSGSINAKGATATAIFGALKGGPMTVKGMKELPPIQAVMEGKYEKSFMAVALSALRSKGLVEQTANRGEWKLTDEGLKAAAEVG